MSVVAHGGKKGGERSGEGAGKNGEPFLTLSPPDLIPLSGHSYIYLVITSPSGVVTLVRKAVRIGLRTTCRTR